MAWPFDKTLASLRLTCKIKVNIKYYKFNAALNATLNAALVVF